MSNNRIIWNSRDKRLLAICESQNSAHALAESLSYIANSNALYGLFGIELTNQDQLCSSKEGREAWSSFFEKI